MLSRLAVLSPQTLRLLEAEVSEHKRAIRFHRAELQEAARQLRELKQLGVEGVTERNQKGVGATHGRHSEDA